MAVNHLRRFHLYNVPHGISPAAEKRHRLTARAERRSPL